MDHLLVFLSPCGLALGIAVAWMILWSFCHREVCRDGWQSHGPFSDLSVTVRSAATDGGGIDHFLVFVPP